jgi:hypothetical protein
LALRTRARARTAAFTVVATLVGLGVGLGAVLVLRDGDGHARRRPQPSVARFRFPSGGQATALRVADGSASVSEPASGAAAVDAFLGAERDGRPDAAFGLLTHAAQESFGSPAAFVDAQADRPQPVGFRVLGEAAGAEGADTRDVTLAVSHQPRLDPFGGFVAARARETWRAVHEDGRWRVQADPVSSHPELPDDAAAPPLVSGWVKALATCDQAGARRLQLAPALYGPGELLGVPCHEGGDWRAGPAVGLDRASDVQPLVEAFGQDVGSFTRLVLVVGPRSRFFAEVAPLGEDWRVIGVTTDGG